MSGFRDRVRRRRPIGPRKRLRCRHAPTSDPRPPVDTEAAIVAIVARAYPRAGNQLEAAARLAARLGWQACCKIEGYQP